MKDMRKGKGRNSGLLPNSFKIISSCLKTVSTNASTVVRSAGATVSASISASSDDRKDQVFLFVNYFASAFAFGGIDCLNLFDSNKCNSLEKSTLYD